MAGVGCGPGVLGQVPGWAETIHQRQEPLQLSFCFPLPQFTLGTLTELSRQDRSLTLLGPEDSEGQWQVKNFKRAVSWPAGGEPLWVAEEESCHHLSSQPYLPLQTLPAS